MTTAAYWLIVLALTGACVVAVTAGGVGLLLLMRRRSVTSQVAVSALVALGCVAAAVAVTARAMFVSGHDLRVVLVVILVTVPAGSVVALAVGRWVGSGSRVLAKAAHTIGDAGYRPAPRPATAELGAVADELDRAHHRLVQARERERAVETSHRQMVTGMSHDLRTPLAGLRAMAEALEDGLVADPATVSRYHQRIRAETDRLAGMVGDLFELSRIQSSPQLHMQRTGLEDLVDEALASAGPLAQAKGINLSGHAQPAVPVEVDATALGRALSNLLANAIRHTPAEGTVEVAAAAEDGRACLAVADSCGGIPAAALPRVFDVGFCGETARTPSADGGAGLGLAIARGIIEAHDGEIAVVNQGNGCRFTVRLPLATR